MTEPFAMVRITTKDIIYLASQWENSPGGGPGSYLQYWNACLEAGAYVRVSESADYYNFHPGKLSAAWEMLEKGTDAYTVAWRGDRAVKEASNITCLWHKRTIYDGKHTDGSDCRKPPVSKKPSQSAAQPARCNGGRTA